MNDSKAPAVRHLYEFGPFSVDATERLFFRDGQHVPLPPKVFDTLLVLVENAGRLMEKDDLMDLVWPDVAVEENNLIQNIAALRRLLGPEHPYIETLPRRGYRFKGEVTERWEEIPGPRLAKDRETPAPRTESQAKTAGGTASATDVRDAADSRGVAPPVLPQPFLSRRVLVIVTVTLTFAAVAAILAYRFGWLGRIATKVDQSGGPSDKYLAVLPFHVLGQERSLDYIGQGLSESISARLFRIPGVTVASVTEAERTRADLPLERIGRQLGVNLILRGDVLVLGQKLRVDVVLEDVARGRRLWSEEFSGSVGSLFELADQIYDRLVSVLEVGDETRALARAGKHPTKDVEAYELYLKGRNAMQRQRELKDLQTAVDFFKLALKRDPGFALAYSGLADASLRMYKQNRDIFLADRALAMALEAQRLDDASPEVHLSLSSAYQETGRLDEAANEVKRALELAPRSDEAYRRLGTLQLARGQNREAFQAFRTAVSINPYYWLNYNELGNAYFKTQAMTPALESFRRVTELEPENIVGYGNISAVYLAEGKWSDAIAPLQKALQIEPHSDTYSNLGTAFFYLKQYANAAAMFEKAVAMNPNQQVLLGNLADAYRWSAQTDKANATYRRAIAMAYAELRMNPGSASALDALALYHAKTGDFPRASEYMKKAREAQPGSAEFIYDDAIVHALASHTEQALTLLTEALRKGYPAKLALEDPEWGEIRKEPRSEALFRQMLAKK